MEGHVVDQELLHRIEVPVPERLAERMHLRLHLIETLAGTVAD
jgi:hypothetical protein